MNIPFKIYRPISIKLTDLTLRIGKSIGIKLAQVVTMDFVHTPFDKRFAEYTGEKLKPLPQAFYNLKLLDYIIR